MFGSLPAIEIMGRYNSENRDDFYHIADPWTSGPLAYNNVAGIKFIGTRSLDCIQARVYDGFSNLKVRIRLL